MAPPSKSKSKVLTHLAFLAFDGGFPRGKRENRAIKRSAKYTRVRISWAKRVGDKNAGSQSVIPHDPHVIYPKDAHPKEQFEDTKRPPW